MASKREKGLKTEHAGSGGSGNMPGSPDPLSLDNQLCFPLYAASRQVVKLYRPHLDAIGLTYTQYITMMVMWEHGEMTVKGLGERLFLDSGTLTPVVKALEEKGLVKRKRSAEDERVVIVKMLPAGQDLRAQAIAVPEKVGGCINLQPDEAMQLYRLLHKVLEDKR